MSSLAEQPATDVSEPSWNSCRFLTCSVLPVRTACNLDCPFCFSKSSISALEQRAFLSANLDLDAYFRFAVERGATRLVITGGGEPLLRPGDVLALVREGSRYFDEITCFTNGTYLTRPLAQSLAEAGMSYLCYSRHHHEDDRCRALMGNGAPTLETFFAAASPLRIRATCVMAAGYIDSPRAVWQYIRRLAEWGVDEFTFKHTYVAYNGSLFAGSPENAWARDHQIESNPFGDSGRLVARLPWGPEVRRIGDHQVCYYFEPSPDWELQHQLCRSINLLADGAVYASLEDTTSFLRQLPKRAASTSSRDRQHVPTASGRTH